MILSRVMILSTFISLFLMIQWYDTFATGNIFFVTGMVNNYLMSKERLFTDDSPSENIIHGQKEITQVC